MKLLLGIWLLSFVPWTIAGFATAREIGTYSDYIYIRTAWLLWAITLIPIVGAFLVCQSIWGS